MFRKAILLTIILCASSIAAVAQFGPVSGRVVTRSTDGKDVGVPGALVEIFRIDMKATLPSAKTDKNGSFTFVGVPFGGNYAIAVSAPGLEPKIFRSIRAGTDQLILNMEAGNGARFTEDQVRQGATMGPGDAAQLTAEQKKQQAAYEEEKKRVEAANEKIKNSTAVIQSSFTAGNEAFKAKNYELAVQKYDEGIAADPAFIGSVPSLSNNRGVAYMYRALEERNKAIQQTDAAAKADGLAKAKQYFNESVKSFLRSWNMLKGASPTAEFPKENFDASKMGALTGARDALRLAARAEAVDQPLMDAAKILIPEYVAVEPDAAKKSDAQLIIGDLYRVNGDYAAAVEAYKKVLETSPDNPDALVGAGLCLFAMGAVNNNDKAMYQEGANFLQKYVSVAPDGHKFKADAQAILEQLRNEQKVTPQKVTTPTRRRGN
jgi:tetratricopeptide (TPR) repeat protein